MKQILHVTVAKHLMYLQSDLEKLKDLFVEASKDGGVVVTEEGVKVQSHWIEDDCVHVKLNEEEE